MKRFMMFLCALFLLLSITSYSVASDYTIKILTADTDTYNNSYPQINSSGQVVWQGVPIGAGDASTEIFFYNGTDIIQLTDNDEYDQNPLINDSGLVVWQRSDGNDIEIFIYNGIETIQLTDNDYADSRYQINDSGQVVWDGKPNGISEDAREIFFYNGTETIQLTDNDYTDYHPQINAGGQVVWLAKCDEDSEIFIYNGTETIQLTDSDSLYESTPQINAGGQVVWEAYTLTPSTYSSDVYLYNGTDTIQKLPDKMYCDSEPQINDSGHVVWWGMNETRDDYALFLYNGTDAVQIADDGWLPKINAGGQVVWAGTSPTHYTSEIFLYNGTDTIQLTDNQVTDTYPQINDSGQVVWQGFTIEGERTISQVFLAVPNVDSDDDGIPDDQDACPDEDATGFDIDGDGCIDSTSGLSEMLEALVTEGIIAEELQTSLLTKVENAEKSADKDNLCAAINKLEALINEIDAQRGNKISDEAADLIVDYTNSVITWLLGQLPADESC